MLGGIPHSTDDRQGAHESGIHGPGREKEGKVLRSDCKISLVPDSLPSPQADSQNDGQVENEPDQIEVVDFHVDVLLENEEVEEDAGSDQFALVLSDRLGALPLPLP